MLLAGIKPTIRTRERPQTHALHRTDTEISAKSIRHIKISTTKNNEIMKHITYEAKDSVGNHKRPLFTQFVTICSCSKYPFWEFNTDYSVLQPVAQSQYRLGKSLTEWKVSSRKLRPCPVTGLFSQSCSFRITGRTQDIVPSCPNQDRHEELWWQILNYKDRSGKKPVSMLTSSFNGKGSKLTLWRLTTTIVVVPQR